jgi:predicted dinucleotide-binding enzyme
MSTKRRIGIIGNGNVGGALARGLTREGHEVKAVGKDPSAVRGVSDWAQVVILAVPFGAVSDAVREAGGGLDGKTVIDATNALGPKMELAVGFSTSGAEELQKQAPRAKVVKAFNTVFAQSMERGQVNGKQVAALVASDDAGARSEALELARDLGFDAVDAGNLQTARLLEPMGALNIQLGYGQKLGTGVNLTLLRG